MKDNQVHTEKVPLFSSKIFCLYKKLRSPFFWLSDSEVFEKDVEELPAIMWTSKTALKHINKEYLLAESEVFEVQERRIKKCYDLLKQIDIIGSEVEIKTRTGQLTIPSDDFCKVLNLVDSIIQSMNEYHKYLQAEISDFYDLSIKASVCHMIFLEQAGIIRNAYEMHGTGMTNELEQRSIKYGKARKHIQMEYNIHMVHFNNHGWFDFTISAVTDAMEKLKNIREYRPAYLLAQEWIEKYNSKIKKIK